MAKLLDKTNLSSEKLEAIVKLFRAGQEDIFDLLFKNIDKTLTKNSKDTLLAELTVILGAMSARSKQWFATVLPEAYKAGLKFVDRSVDQSAPITADHIDIVNELIDAGSLRVDIALDVARRDFQLIVDQALTDQIRLKLSSVEGDSIQDIAKDIEKLIKDRGITGMFDRRGRAVSLQNYAEMVARTEVLRAANLGVLNRGLQYGVDIYEVSYHAGVDPNDKPCIDNAGKKFSASGTSENFPPLELDNIPPYHPNCRHILIPRPDLE